MRQVLALAGVASSRLSFNSMTAERWPLEEVIDACAEYGIEWIGPWRHKLAELGVEEARRRIDAAGLKVSSLCRGGFFAAENAETRQPARGRGGRGARHRRARARVRPAGHEGPRGRASDDRARHRAAAPARQRARRPARHRAAAPDDDRRAQRHHHARRGARHRRAHRRPRRRRRDRRLPHVLGPAAGGTTSPAPRAGSSATTSTTGWPATQHTLLERGMMGDGIIDLHGFSAMIEAAGYVGPIEVEILNPAIWDLPREELMAHDRRALRAMRALARLDRRSRAAPAGAAARRARRCSRRAPCARPACPSRAAGTLTVVSPTKRAGRRSSMPAIETSPGTSTPASRSRISTPIAASSLAATIASGSRPRASSFSAARTPSS